MLRARREHPIRLQASLGRQVVDHRADVARLAAEHERSLLRGGLRRIDSRKQTLSSGLFVSGRSVDLAGEKQPRQPLGLEASMQFGRLNEIVLDRVAWPHHYCVLEPRKRVHQLLLHGRRQAHRVAVDVDLVDVEPFGLEKQLVPLAMREPHHLVLERRAVARADAADLAVEERRLANVLPHELVDTVGRVQQVAINLVAR